MRLSSASSRPSVIAILSTALLSSLSGTASHKRHRLRHPASQHHGSERRGKWQGRTAGGNATRVRSGGTPSGPDIAIHSNGDWTPTTGTPSAARGPIMAKLPGSERGSSLQRWLRISFRHGKDPWVGCSDRRVILSFLSNLQRHTHSQGLRAMRRNQNVPGLGPTTILVVLHRHAGWGEISGHRRESKQVAHAYLGSIADS